MLKLAPPCMSIDVCPELTMNRYNANFFLKNPNFLVTLSLNVVKSKGETTKARSLGLQYNKKIVHTRDGGGGILEAGNEFGFTRTPNDTIQNGVPEHVEDSSR